MDFKLIIAIVAAVLTVVGYGAYFRDIFAKKTKPHLYTWLIWVITLGTATVALLHGGGKFGSLSLIIGTVLVFSVFILSFKYGTKDINKKDAVVLILALMAVVVWWQLDNPLAAVLMVTAIDGAGYIPTIRKSFNDPWSETISFWIIMTIAGFLTLISNAEYNFLTVTYLAVLSVVDVLVILICLVRRRVVERK